MRLKEYINEGSNSTAFFISPYGKLVETGARKHINMVIDYPEKFGLTKEYINDIYQKYGEKMGIEGKARNDILTLLIKQGWIRIRLYPNKFWTVNVPRMNRKVKDYLHDWASKMIDKFSADKFMPVRIMDTAKYNKQMTIIDISKDKLFNESITHEREVLEFSTLEELEDLI